MRLCAYGLPAMGSRAVIDRYDSRHTKYGRVLGSEPRVQFCSYSVGSCVWLFVCCGWLSYHVFPSRRFFLSTCDICRHIFFAVDLVIMPSDKIRVFGIMSRVR